MLSHPSTENKPRLIPGFKKWFIVLLPSSYPGFTYTLDVADLPLVDILLLSCLFQRYLGDSIGFRAI